MVNLEFKGKIIVKADIHVVTGLQIGKENSMEIGGIDNPVIKDSLGKPYIPGSSLKGKLRTLMEYFHGKIKNDVLVVAKGGENQIRIHQCDEKDCPVCNLFGRNHGKHRYASNPDVEVEFKNIMPTRLFVRDALLDENSITEEMKKNLDNEFTEVKPENTLDRITSAANPRFNERVPAGAIFKSEFVINVYDDDNEKYLRELLTALSLLEDDYLGGSGSRGYGKVRFENIKIVYKGKGYYDGSNKELPKKELDDLNNWEEKIKDFKLNGD
ncbi:CRISPR-associated protein Csm3 [Thermosipho melanesiensis]|uniref:CRISPR system Cms endoribonuclease Csm3 n=2 Tax=Thermosipho melanesiensis TaxID=46541 RepID=A6LNL4_THEM4|nr:type III-A CRISPR-associated RAMP protein Csm3 [Thermosipho melanesiensis]ABR31515.1 CRISPR-associated RAMP protein, Csm3 family [Thermosipho melanesiensis BI429]APT74563.1 CRISPR-associated protein Csm3 [Thermosipho melanesiensis]OOC35263.1 CRISPR-associated protein Csm3 [Thermosipho melanesiensis]OOC35482.1 CRISPR-associated protein Csm3 [Thermosipho melanesiensis]OOC36518.1 CRISPR-associated protein Csm3 [Thermosipho melanesiensis]